MLCGCAWGSKRPRRDEDYISIDEYQIMEERHRREQEMLLTRIERLELLVHNITTVLNDKGDEEKKRGIQPIPMMDRVNKDDIPKQQIGFINFICKPAYQTLSALPPVTNPLYEGYVPNAENWQLAAMEKSNVV